MPRRKNLIVCLLYLLMACAFSGSAFSQGKGWTNLLADPVLDNTWTQVDASGSGYVLKDGVLTLPSDAGGRLFTKKQYSDFILRVEFRTEAGGNNGIGIRTPMDTDPAYGGMELQVLDDPHPSYAGLRPSQYTMSIYGVVPVKRGALKPAGQWNKADITARGRQIKIKLNGKVVVNADLNTITDPQMLATHPGLLRDAGHIGFMGHGPAEVQFRNVWVKDLAKPQKDNVPPPGFKALFNGKDLTGWKGLVENPPARHKMSPEELAQKEAAATLEAAKHWLVKDGAITYDGKNESLCTAKDYADFEMLVDWKIEPGGDSGIYLRGTPQVQIWDNPIGSGALYNNQKNPSQPTKNADNPPGKWNRFRILMQDEKVTVFLNGELVFHNVTMENYWERDKPIYRAEQIELQHHHSPLWFKNIYIRELPAR